MTKIYCLRKAADEGFDDTVFVNRYGRLGEGAIWNLAFWNGEVVVWPTADMLGGIIMTILRRQLNRMGVQQKEQEITLADVAALVGAVVMNSWTSGIAICQFGATPVPESQTFLELRYSVYDAEPLVAP